jgi:ankyrin repeat protein
MTNVAHIPWMPPMGSWSPEQWAWLLATIFKRTGWPIDAVTLHFNLQDLPQNDFVRRVGERFSDVIHTERYSGSMGPYMSLLFPLPENDSDHWKHCAHCNALESTAQDAAGNVGVKFAYCPCNPEGRPFYCNEQCQLADWPVHKQFCTQTVFFLSSSKNVLSSSKKGKKDKKKKKKKSDEVLPAKKSSQDSQVGSSSFEKGGGDSGGDDMFLDVDKSNDELPTTAAKKRGKKKSRKKKEATAPPPEKKSQEDFSHEDEEGRRALDKWLSEGAPLTRKVALRSDILIRAVQVGHVEAVRVLLEKPGIRVLLEVPGPPKSGTKISALYVAALRGNSVILRLLLAKPVIQINRATPCGETALHVASRGGHSEAVKLLLDAGADKAAKTSDGETPLYDASGEGHSEVVKILLNAGADKKATTSNGFTSLHVASQNGRAEVVKVLLNAGADKEATTSIGCTSLMFASLDGHLEVVKILLDAGADLDATTPCGRTSLEAAYSQGHLEVGQALLNAGTSRGGPSDALQLDAMLSNCFDRMSPTLNNIY